MNIYTYDEYLEAELRGENPDTDRKMYNTVISPVFLTYLKRRNAQYREYVYLYTFTLRTDVTDPEDTIENYIVKALKQPSLEVKACHLVKEYTKKGVAHWHACVTTKKPLEVGRFWYYKKKYGVVQNSKDKTILAKMRSNPQKHDDIMKYLNKEFSSKKII